MSDLVAVWKERIERDLAPFIDPGSELLIIEDGAVIEATWEQRRVVRQARFRVSLAGGEVEVECGSNRTTYTAFFAGEDMADLIGIAKGSLARLKNSIYVETFAKDSNAEIDTESPAISLIRSCVEKSDSSDLLTDLVMITAEAGAGKTSVLKELVRQQADLFVRGQSRYLYLYVDAQGRALARFNEALATELNELRVMLPFHAVSTLVRLGLLVPVIDGFDELIGVGGYDDAFNSISSFVEELNGSGVILASARSTYYEQEFLSRANRASALGEQSWKLDSIEIRGWAEIQRRQYVDWRCKENGQSDSIALALTKIFSGENEELADKPLFIVRAVDILMTGGDLEGSGGLLERLISSFLQREQRDKLRDRNERPILSVVQLRSLCEDFSEEMWAQGTRELDRSTVKDLAELVLSDTSLSSSDQHVVMERMPTMAFLQVGESYGAVAFEHELFFSQFLANRFAKKISSSAQGLSLLLGRSVMPDSLAHGVAAKLHEMVVAGEVTVSSLVAILCAASAEFSPKQGQVKENAGRIVAALLARLEVPCESINIRDVVFPGSSMRGIQFSACTFSDVEFRRADFSNLKFIGCCGDRLVFESVLVDGCTVLELVGQVDVSSFNGLRVASADGGIVQLFDPTKVRGELNARGFPAAKASDPSAVRNVSDDVVRLVDRLARAYTRCNPVCVQDRTFAGIFDDVRWGGVERVAIDSGVVRSETRSAHGPRRKFLRRTVTPAELMSGFDTRENVNASVRAFWEGLEQLYPKQGSGSTFNS
ncbi:NACHT domain-containing protein [Luteimonas aquatica]|uniref:NACHT domain-containing protein n=1 Tax=Luteimonas aquatica TaxID=450364 RepID=UPI001F5739A0|nr:ATP-binding protein [Luteimonas aquatica]